MPTAPPMVVLATMALVGMVAGGIWLAIGGALRHYRAVNETISSLLLNYIAIAVLNHLVTSTFRDPGKSQSSLDASYWRGQYDRPHPRTNLH